MVVLPVLFLLGSLFLCGHGEYQPTISEMLAEAALTLEEPLQCEKWDCNCSFYHQRGCCCAASDMFKLEEDTFLRIKYLWHAVISLKYRIHDHIEYRHVSFKATMDPGANVNSCFGPFNTNVPIPYSIVTLNDDNAYNPALGIFTAPCDGVFVFSFTVYSYIERRLYHQVQLMKNGVLIASVWEHNQEDSEDNGNHVVVLELLRGDQVYTELMSGRRLCGHLDYNIFTGYILYPTITYTDNEYEY